MGCYMIVVSGPASPRLSKRVSEVLGAPILQLETKTFPDGETYVRFPQSLTGMDVAVIQSCYPPQNKNLLDLLFILDAVKEMGAKRTAAVVPYFAYARQDDSYRTGEAVSARTMARLIESVGVTDFLTVDVPSNKALQYFAIRAKNVTCMKVIADHLRRLDLRNPFVLAPDDGAIPLASTVSTRLETDYAWFEKTRDKISGAVSTSGKDVDLKDRDAVIVDDVISTGKTIANTAQIAKRQGAKKVIAACAHPLLIGDAEATLRSAGVHEIIGTDSIEDESPSVSIGCVLAEALRTIW